MTGHNPTDAVTIQIQQRVDHIIKDLLPQMHGLLILTAESMLSRTQEIAKFQDIIRTINNNFNIALQTNNTTHSVSKSKSNIIIPTMLEDGKRNHYTVSQLLPASSEAKQRRKISHSTM